MRGFGTISAARGDSKTNTGGEGGREAKPILFIAELWHEGVLKNSLEDFVKQT